MAETEWTTIARPYARAVFQHAIEGREGLGRWSEMLGLLMSLAADGRVQELLDDPSVSRLVKAQRLIELCDDALSDQARNFLRILAEQDRLAAIGQIAELFEALKVEYEKKIEVKVTSAFEISEDERRKLTDTLRQLLSRDVEIEAAVDSSLLGGVVIHAGDTVIDHSVRGKLAKLSQAMHG